MSPVRTASLILAFGTMVSARLALAGGCDGGTWVAHAPMSLARQETGAARIGGKVYVVGGLIDGDNLEATNTAEAYDIALDQWSDLPPMPVALDHMGAVALHGRLYVIGGDFVPRRDVYIFDPGPGGGWSAGPLLPQARGGGWAVAHFDRIYFFGGVGPGGVSRTTYIFDPVSNGWTTGADMPTAREHLMAVSAGAYIHVLGGRNGASTDVHERYDPLANQWATMAPMLTPRSAAGAARLGSRIVVAGGEVPALFDVNEVYDIATDTWDCRDPMPIPRHGVAAVALDDRILFPGGGVVQGLDATDAVDAFVDLPVDVPPSRPARLALGVHPNPARREVDIRWTQAVAERITLEICDLHGRRIRTLADREPHAAGGAALRWDGRDDQGRPVSAGLYFVRLTGTATITRRVILLR